MCFDMQPEVQSRSSMNLQRVLPPVGDGSVLRQSETAKHLHVDYNPRDGAQCNILSCDAVSNMARCLDDSRQHANTIIHKVNNDSVFQGPTPLRLALRGRARSHTSYAHRCICTQRAYLSSVLSCSASSSYMSCYACCRLGLTVCLCV